MIKTCLYVTLVWQRLAGTALQTSASVRWLLRRPLLTMKIKRILYTAGRTGRSTGAQKNITGRSQAILTSHTYCRADETPLNLFIRASRGDYRALVKHNSPAMELLREAYAMLVTEFCRLSGNGEYGKMYGIYMGIAKTQARLMQVRSLLKQKALGMDVEKKLKSATAGRPVESFAASTAKERDRYLAQLDASMKDETGSGNPGMDFERILTDLSAWLKFNIRAEDITVSRFACYISDYHKYIETLNRQKLKIKS